GPAADGVVTLTVATGTGRSNSVGAASAGSGATTSTSLGAARLAFTGTISTGSNGRGGGACDFERTVPLGFTPTAPTTALQSEAQRTTVAKRTRRVESDSEGIGGCRSSMNPIA